MQKLGLINPRNITEEEAATYRLREAVRAIVCDEGGRMALLQVSRDGYFKLPGGGVEMGGYLKKHYAVSVSKKLVAP